MDIYQYFIEYLNTPDSDKQIYLAKLAEEKPVIAKELSLFISSSDDFTAQLHHSINKIQSSEVENKVGDTVGIYQLVEALGNGGMGQVFKAQRVDGKIEQTVAIKFLHPIFYQYQSGALIYREAQALAKLNHPNIASIFDISETDLNQAYIVMEYVEGLALDTYLKQKRLDTSEKLIIFKKIADAVLEAHTKQIIHADIKPSNVLVTKSGEPKLIDFGVSELAKNQQGTNEIVKHYLCAMTVNYAAPEQLNGETASISSDIYGLGGLLYFILAGKSAYEDIGGTLDEKISHIISQPIPSLINVTRVKFNYQLQSIVEKCLAKKREQRYRTTTDLINDLKNYQVFKPIEANKLSYGTKLWFYRNRVASIFSLLLMVIVATSVFQIYSEKRALELANQELKNSYENQLETIEAALDGVNKRIVFPEVNNFTPKQFTELMLIIADNYLLMRDQLRAEETLVKLESEIELALLSEFQKRQIDIRKLLVIQSNDSARVEKLDEHLKYFNLVQFDKSHIDILRILATFSPFLSKADELPFFVERILKEISFNSLDDSKVVRYRIALAAYYYESQNNTSLAITHIHEAYEISLHNKSIVTAADFIEILNIYALMKSDLGQFDEQYKKVRIQLLSAIKSLGNNNELYWYYIGETLNEYLEVDFASALTFSESIDEGHGVNFTYFYRYLRAKRYILKKLGRYEKALEISNKLMTDYREHYTHSGNDDTWLTWQAISLIENGDLSHAIDQINNELRLNERDDLTTDWQTYYQDQLCRALKFYEQNEIINQVCKGTFLMMSEEFGEGEYWTKQSLISYVHWISKQVSIENETEYVNKLESIVLESSENIDIINRSSALIHYYIARGELEGLNRNIEIQNKAIKDHFKNIDVIDKYLNKIYQTEALILQSNSEGARNLISEISPRLCSYDNKVPIKKYLLRVAKKIGYSACT